MPPPRSPSNAHMGSGVPPAQNTRIAAILHEAELSPPERIPTLASPQVRAFEASQINIEEARALLVQQRISDPSYRQPEQQKRHIFRSKKTKEAKCNTANWVFTKHEVAKAFDDLLSRTPLPEHGIAEALLSLHVSIASLEELWCHFYDPNLEQRTGRGSGSTRSSALPKSISSVALKNRSSVVLGTASVTIPKITWLDEVCSQRNLEYIRLMCQAGLEQDALDRAFRIALSKHSMEAMELLLSYGAAVSSACQDAIRERVKLHDVALMRLLLAAPHAMTVEAWRFCLEPEVQSLEARRNRSPQLLLLCLAHHPEVISSSLLQQALQLQNFPAMVTMLAYGRFFDDSFRSVRQLACEVASGVQDDERRYNIFKVLFKSDFVTMEVDSLILREELMKDVKAHHLPLIKLLVDAGVIVDLEPHNAFYWAISRMQFDILELFKNCELTSPVSLALKIVPNSISESYMLRLVDILGPRGLEGPPLNSTLIRAVKRQQVRLVERLIHYGASVEFEDASAIRMALENADLKILGILLQNKCSADFLSATIPSAMALKPRSIRLQAMTALVEKGVLPQNLGVSLQALVSEEGDIDTKLIQLLLRHKAPADAVGGETKNAVCVAARRGNFSILRMLCDANPRNETLSKAVPVAFGVIETCGYDVALNMIDLLLQKGATGPPVQQTVLASATQRQLGMVRLFVKHGADVEPLSGALLHVALTTANHELLQIICESCSPSQASVESTFYVALDPRYYDSEVLDLLLSSSCNAEAALNSMWSSERLRGNPNIIAIVACLLRHGLDVNLQNGAPLSFAVRERNFILLAQLLSASPSRTSLAAAFRATNHTQPRSLELVFMKLLLEKARSAEIGQSESLLQQTECALSGDFAGLQLLLRHKAAPYPAATFTKICLATASSQLKWDEKQEIFELVLAPGALVSTDEMSKLLALCVTTHPDATQLPQLLVAHGSKVSLESLKTALENSSLELLDVLLSGVRSAGKAENAFRLAQKTTMASDKRYRVYQHLLAKGVSSDAVSEALLESLKFKNLHDLSLPKLLLENGASPGYRDCASFSVAIRAKYPISLVAVRLLIQHIANDNMATVAFDVIQKTPLLNHELRMEVYRPLLEWNIGKPSVSQVLVDSFKGGRPDTSFMQLLLAKGADPNKDNGYCFAVTAKIGALTKFRVLSKYAKQQVVLKVLLENFQEESEVVKWFRVCLDEQPRPQTINDDELLFTCMRKFPKGATLLNLLLDQGVSASAKIDHRLCRGWQPERCTALIWALFRKPKIENSTIIVLLSRGDAGM